MTLKAVAGGGGGAASGITIGTSVITGGTTGRLLYDLASVVSETAQWTYAAASGLLQGTATSAIAIGGATIGSNALAVTGPVTFGVSGDGIAALTINYQGNTTDAEPHGLMNNAYDNTNHGVHYSFRKARGTLAAPTALQTADFPGGLVGWPYDGANYQNTYSFAGYVSGAVGAASIPTTAFIAAGISTATNKPRLLVDGNTGFVGVNSNLIYTPAFKFEIISESSITGDGVIANTLYSDDTASAGFVGRKARGTVSAPTKTLNGDAITALLARGYEQVSPGFGSGNVGAVIIRAAGDFTNASQPTQIEFGTTPNASLTRVLRWTIDLNGHLIAGTDNTYDIGASGATRPRRVYAGTGFTTAGGAVFLTTSTALTDGAGASAGTIANAPSIGNPTKWIGINDNGTTRYIPAW